MTTVRLLFGQGICLGWPARPPAFPEMLMPLERRTLGRTDATVPNLCLGTMMYGDQIDEAEAARQMDRCFERGIDFFDTAELYTIPPKPETQGESERIVGRWMADRGRRSDIILATKVTGRSPLAHIRDGEPPRVTPVQMRQAIERSLRNLQTDYVDLYQIHWPDRQTALFGTDLRGYRVPKRKDGVPIDEQLGTLGELVKEGKVRHIGLSNETPWGVMSFLRAAEAHGLPRVVSIQNAYNLLNRSFESGLAEITMEEQVGLLAYSPLAQGVISGKYLDGQKPAGARGTLFGRLERYQTPSSEAAIRAYVNLAADLGVDPNILAMQFVTTRPWVTSNIFGARNQEQLDVIFASLDFEMSDDMLDRINDIHVTHPNPCP